ncbi:hypothetical protein H6503_03060 [Candidatus Woesearchaeota archaeon]|nr:hypothetical protein [Candidatus Woesearchaeota archaeon]
MLEKIIKKTANFFAATALLASPLNASEIDSISLEKVGEPTYQATEGYDIEFIQPDPQYAEWRLLYDGEHFGSLIQDRGNVVFRGHPGDDVDEWGASYYLRPFFPGATMYGLESWQTLIVVGSGIHLMMSGMIPYGTSSSNTTGHFDYQMLFSFDKQNKKITGTGTYNINLDTTIASLGKGDLNLLKIATSRLTGVPLTDGTTGNTGDTEDIHVKGKNLDFTWNWLAQSSHYPQDKTHYLEIDLSPCHNIVDTVRQSYEAINTAYKPGLRLVISNDVPNINMIFGGQYNLAQKTYYWADNVGVTPLMLQSESKTNFNFSVNMEWDAHPDDKLQDTVTIDATEATKAFLGIYETGDLTNSLRRIGSLKRRADGHYQGTIKIEPNDKWFYTVSEEQF